MYLKDLHLLQSDLLTFTMIFGQMNGLQNQTRVCRTQHIHVCQEKLNQELPKLKTRATCADEQDIIGAVHRLHSVHHQFTEFVVNTHSDQKGALSQRQHTFLWESKSNNDFNSNAIARVLLHENEIGLNLIRMNQYDLISTMNELNL